MLEKHGHCVEETEEYVEEVFIYIYMDVFSDN